ncbi:MAG: hypothetical protein L6Q55_12720 [Azonexus sp.]|nr:hypothetical protein [Azonexus sp.]MCK6413273.1 hypothetical protein [Azonexus sp.]
MIDKLFIRLALAGLLLSVSAVAQTQEQGATDAAQLQNKPENAKKKVDDILENLGLAIGPGVKGSYGYFASFEKRESDWNLTDISTTRPSVTDFSRQEILVFSNDLKSVQPDFRTYLLDSKKESFVCWTGALRTRKDNATTDYNPCESSLTTTSNFHVGAQVLATVVTLGLYSATGTSSRNVVVDKEKVLALIQQTGALERVREKKATTDREKFLSSYRSLFSSAKTSAHFDTFVRKYSDNDPENLVPQAIARRDELSKTEAEEIRRRETEASLRREAQARAEDERRLYEQEQQRQRIAQVEAFRRTIKIETETNCGPVLEIKGALVKIYSPVANYGNEHWVRKSQLFPTQYGCRFVNGNYQPPAL